jgi:hypothetical protein
MPALHPDPVRAERYLRRALWILSIVAALLVLGHLTLMFWARHEFTQVESVVANHSSGWALGRGIYFPLQDYPYTVSPYMPLFYFLQGVVYRLGLGIFHAGRLLSFLALVGVFLLSRRLLRLHLADRYSVWAGTLLVASSTTLLSWGTVGQVDLLGVCASLAGFYFYNRFHQAGSNGRTRDLFWAGLCFVAALFTKQTMIAAPAAVIVLLAFKSPRRAVWFAGLTGGVVAGLALLSNHLTGGGFFTNTLWANLNPFSWFKVWQQAHYLALAGGCLAVLAVAGLREPGRRAGHGRIHPFHLYLAMTFLVLAVTAPKVGSDLNYQVEITIAMGLCAAWTLDRCDFFGRCLRGDRGWIPLLQLPLLLYLVVNLGASVNLLLSRLGAELVRREEYAALRPYLEASPGPVLSVQLDPLIQSGRPIEVEPLIYTLLVEAGRIQRERVEQDLETERFGLVILYEDVFASPAQSRGPELPSLPESQLEQLRRHYRLVRHIPGPFVNGDYVYLPVAREASLALSRGGVTGGPR